MLVLLVLGDCYTNRQLAKSSPVKYSNFSIKQTVSGAAPQKIPIHQKCLAMERVLVQFPQTRYKSYCAVLILL